MILDVSTPLLPFFDPDTVFFILLLGFLFFELAHWVSNGSAKDKSGGAKSEIEKLLWFATLGLVIYSIFVLGISISIHNTINSSPVGGVIISHIKPPFFVEFFNLAGMIKLLGTPESILGSTVIWFTIIYIMIIFVMTLFFIPILKQKAESQVRISSILAIYLLVTVYISLISALTLFGHILYSILAISVFIVSLICLTRVYSRRNQFIEKHKKISGLRYFVYIIVIEILAFVTIFLSYSIKNVNGIIFPSYYAILGLDSSLLIVTAIIIYDEKDKSKEVLYLLAFILIASMMQYSLNGLQNLTPSSHVTVQNVTLSNVSYSISGYITPNNTKTAITNNGTFLFHGTITMPTGLNYTYFTTINNSNSYGNYPPLNSETFYNVKQFNPSLIKTYIENETLPPGHFVGCNGMQYCCITNTSKVSCYPQDIENSTYLIVSGGGTKGLQSVNISSIYSLAFNSTISVEELNYSYYTTKNCSLSSCNINIGFKPTFGSTVVLNYIGVYLPNDYSNITLAVQNQTCQNYHSIVRSTDSCFKLPIGDTGEITYSGTSTNYVYLNWIIYNGTTLNLNLTMTNN